jgi:hypothetical protein
MNDTYSRIYDVAQLYISCIIGHLPSGNCIAVKALKEVFIQSMILISDARIKRDLSRDLIIITLLWLKCIHILLIIS